MIVLGTTPHCRNCPLHSGQARSEGSSAGPRHFPRRAHDPIRFSTYLQSPLRSMKYTLLFLPLLFVTSAMIPACGQSARTVDLPEPDRTGTISVEQALNQRRSVRTYTNEPLTLLEVSQLLWAAQGRTHRRGNRTAPSAGALYPLELYLTGGRVENLSSGVYRYRPEDHMLVATGAEDRRTALADAALDQTWVQEGAVVLVVAAVYE